MNEKEKVNKPIYAMTPEEKREAGRKGGLKSAEVRRRKKAMKEAYDVILGMPLKGGKQYDTEDIKNFAAVKGKNISVQDAILMAQVQKALRGDTNAAAFIRDTIGDKAADKVDLSGEVATPIVIRDDIGMGEEKDGGSND